MSTLHTDLAEVMQQVGYVQKDGKNDFHKYKYATAAAALSKVNTELSKRGICVASECSSVHYEPGHAVVHVKLKLTRGDDVISIEGLGEGSDKGDKAIMKAMRAATKYALSSGFLISWGDDPEQDSSTDSQADEFDSLLDAVKTASSLGSLENSADRVKKAINENRLTPAQSKKLKSAYETRKTLLS